MICVFPSPKPKSDLVSGEYLFRMLPRGRGKPAATHLVTAEILEGRHDGQRVTFSLAPSAARCFASPRQIWYLAARGACCMAKVSVRTDNQGRRVNRVTRLAFLGYEPSGLRDCELN